MSKQNGQKKTPQEMQQLRAHLKLLNQELAKRVEWPADAAFADLVEKGPRITFFHIGSGAFVQTVLEGVELENVQGSETLLDQLFEKMGFQLKVVLQNAGVQKFRAAQAAARGQRPSPLVVPRRA